MRAGVVMAAVLLVAAVSGQILAPIVISGGQPHNAILITGSAGGAQTDYPVKITLAYDSEMQPDFSDVRFYSSAFAPLNYWIESKTNSSTADFWVKIPSIPASPSTVTVYAYYGNTLATSYAGGLGVFPKFAEFLNDYNESYKGLIVGAGPWASGSWEATEAAFGIYASLLGHPAAIHYVGAQDRTYVSYQNASFNPRLIYYDHNAGTWSSPVQVATNPIAPDDHGPPTLAVDPSGFIYCFFGSHSTAQKVSKSNSAESIAAWTAKTDVDPYASYPQPRIRADGTIQVFYRRATSSGGTGTYFAFKTSTDAAATWSSATDVVQFTAGATSIYGIVNYQSDTVIDLAWFKWVETDGLSGRKNVYYAHSADAGATWTKADGTSLTLPIDEGAAEKVYDSGSDQAYIWDLKSDSSGRPVIFFNTGTDATATYKCARWSGSSWAVTTITSTHWARNLGSIDIVSDTVFDAYVFKGSFSGRGGELMRYRSTDSGATWVFAESLMPYNPTFKGFSSQMVKNYDPAVKVVWGTGWVSPSNVAFSGTAAQVGAILRMAPVFVEFGGSAVSETTAQSLSAPNSLLFPTTGYARTAPLAGTLGAIAFEFNEYFSQATARANTIAVMDAGNNFSTDSGAFVKFDGGKVYAFSGSYVDTTLTYGTGWSKVKIIQRATDFDITVNGVTKTAAANRNTISDINKFHIEADSTFAGYVDNMIVRPYVSPEPTYSVGAKSR